MLKIAVNVFELNVDKCELNTNKYKSIVKIFELNINMLKTIKKEYYLIVLVLILCITAPLLGDTFDYKLPDELDFCGERVPLNNPEVKERAEREFYLLLQQKGQVVLYIKRAGKYFPTYERLLKEQSLPDDLKYLSVAESALYQSRSSKSAYGLWQFMEGTGKTYGLQINKFVDERANVEKSTAAAIKYLANGKKSLGS